MTEAEMLEKSVDFLLERAREFQDRVGDPAQLPEKVVSTDPAHRRDAILFAVSHLLFSGAVVEANIAQYLNERVSRADFATLRSLPRRVLEKTTPLDQWINMDAWKGRGPFENVPNALGSLAFLVVVLFFFESYCKVVLGERRLKKVIGKRRLSLDDILDWLLGQPGIDTTKLNTVEFLNEYRNAWHSFGRYEGDPLPPCKGIQITPGQMLPIIGPAKRLELLRDLLEMFSEVEKFKEPAP